MSELMDPAKMNILDLTKYQKLFIATRYWLLGAAENDERYFKVLEVMEFAASHHDGKRNGGDPEFIHQLGIFQYVRTLHKHLKNPVMVYMLIFGHDMLEDPNQRTNAYVNPQDVEDCWGAEFLVKLKKMSKNILGQKNEAYSLDEIFADEDCGPAKGGDRVDNVDSMLTVFKRSRLERYLKETVHEFLPRLKSARRMFPHQEAVYENIKRSLLNTVTLISHVIEGYVPNE